MVPDAPARRKARLIAACVLVAGDVVLRLALEGEEVVPLVLQGLDYSCGAASLATLLNGAGIGCKVTDNVVAAPQESLRDVRADEAGNAGYQDFHGGILAFVANTWLS